MVYFIYIYVKGAEVGKAGADMAHVPVIVVVALEHEHELVQRKTLQLLEIALVL